MEYKGLFKLLLDWNETTIQAGMNGDNIRASLEHLKHNVSTLLLGHGGFDSS